MIGYGTHNQPVGTWSDDSSLAFCLAESLCQGLDLRDIADKCCKWLYEGYWTPYGVVFDVGTTTREAISRLKSGVDPLKAGSKDERSNGNGSLMRILPLVYYLEKLETAKQFEITHQVSCLTHGHLRSQMACGIYMQVALNILKGDTPESAYKNMKDVVVEYYSKHPYVTELNNFARILENDISEFPEDSINSNGYVVDTLEASLWCFLNANSYADAVLTAVNLGNDTDTTGAVAGGLAGIYYGFRNIDESWINKIARKQDIIKLAEKLNWRIYGRTSEKGEVLCLD
jgi:ADP-ribosylglycohydrolase